MDNIKMEDIQEVPTSETIEETTEEVTTESEVSEAEQDLLKDELDRVQKGGRTEAEKAAFSLKKNAERARELGLDPTEILGIKEEPLDDDDTPVTMGMFKKLQEEKVVKTALQLADEISTSIERELVKYHIENTIKSTGNPTEDLRHARAIVNEAKNRQVIEEVQRKGLVKTHSSATSAPAKQVDQEPELTVQELAFMRPPFNLSKDEIVAARKK